MVSASKPTRKSNGPRVVGRLLLVAALVVAVGLFVAERNASTPARDAYNALDDALAGVDSLTIEDVRTIVRRDPATAYDHPTQNHRFVEEYEWRGLFRTYRVYCYYQSAATKLLDSVSFNQPRDE